MATYSDLATIRNSSVFLDRCTIAVTKYAQFIIGESASTTDHNRRFNWASHAILSPGSTASQLANAIVLDPTFTELADGTTSIDTITDTQMQSAVEATINATLLAY